MEREAAMVGVRDRGAGRTRGVDAADSVAEVAEEKAADQQALKSVAWQAPALPTGEADVNKFVILCYAFDAGSSSFYNNNLLIKNILLYEHDNHNGSRY